MAEEEEELIFTTHPLDIHRMRALRADELPSARFLTTVALQHACFEARMDVLHFLFEELDLMPEEDESLAALLQLMSVVVNQQQRRAAVRYMMANCAVDLQSYSLLYQSIRVCDQEMVSLLVEVFESNVHAVHPEWRETPTVSAVRFADVFVAELMNRHSGELNPLFTSSCNTNQLVRLVLYNRRLDMLRFVDRHCTIHWDQLKWDDPHGTLLHVALSHVFSTMLFSEQLELVEIVRFLFSKSLYLRTVACRLQHPLDDGSTLLHVVARYGLGLLAEVLVLEGNADPNQRNWKGYLPEDFTYNENLKKFLRR